MKNLIYLFIAMFTLVSTAQDDVVFTLGAPLEIECLNAGGLTIAFYLDTNANGVVDETVDEFIVGAFFCDPENTENIPPYSILKQQSDVNCSSGSVGKVIQFYEDLNDNGEYDIFEDRAIILFQVCDGKVTR